jgi:hypothetical protein
VLGLCLAFVSQLRAADASAKVYVILWFDTEDYILPASDDAALRLADFLSREGIRATFKVVGEKARTLERRQRSDVIAALKQHEIGYHSNWHSVQPSPAMYLADLGWDDGVAEFDRRERPGYQDIQRIFGTAPSCYGQPGSSWAPQVFGAMRRWGMETYLDAGGHVGLDDKPCYYGGALNFYKLAHTLRTDLGGEKDLKKAEDRFLSAREKLLEERGGVVSVYYHPCEFVHKEFWDSANFRNGANPPREQWKLPAAKTPEQSRVAYETFEGYIRFMKRFPEVRFIVASEGARLYRDKARGRKFSPAELRVVAAAVEEPVRFQKREDYALAPSEIFCLLNDYIAERGAGRNPESVQLKATPFGPAHPAPAMVEPALTSASQFTRTAADLAEALRKQEQIPTAVWVGSKSVSPEAYLRALARVALDLLDGKPMPEVVEIKPAPLDSAGVAEDSPNLWRWIIFPRGFRAPALMELAKRQAWTLKPAILHQPD